MQLFKNQDKTDHCARVIVSSVGKVDQLAVAHSRGGRLILDTPLKVSAFFDSSLSFLSLQLKAIRSRGSALNHMRSEALARGDSVNGLDERRWSTSAEVNATALRFNSPNDKLLTNMNKISNDTNGDICDLCNLKLKRL